VALGAPAEVVAGVLFVGGAISGGLTGASAIHNVANGNYAAAAYDVGSLGGGAIAGGAVGGAVGDSINFPASRGWSLSGDLGNLYDPSMGTPGQWMGTGPDQGAATGALSGAAGCIAKFLRGGVLMTLWTLLLGVCFFTGVGAAFDTARQAHAGFAGYVIAIVAGVVLGGLCTLIMWRVGKFAWIYGRSLRSESRQKWCLGIGYLSSVIWITLSGVLGTILTPVLIRLAH